MLHEHYSQTERGKHIGEKNNHCASRKNDHPMISCKYPHNSWNVSSVIPRPCNMCRKWLSKSSRYSLKYLSSSHQCHTPDDPNQI